MEALPLSSSIAIASGNAVKVSNYNTGMGSKLSLVCCQRGGNRAVKSTAVTSVVISPAEHGAEGSSSVLSRNGADLVSHGGQSNTSVVEMHEGIGIVKFLKGKTFFITGATGFLGKVLIEKILWTAPDARKIFVLIKAKNKESAIMRLENEIINAEVFKRLKQVHGKSYQAFMRSKIIPVVGNVCQTNLGIDEDIADSLSKEVDVIINSAANTTFDERYDVALDINTAGPKRLIDFAKQCMTLKLFLQISTAYVNGQRKGRIMETPFVMGESINAAELSVEDEMRIVFESKETAGEDESLPEKMKQLGKKRANKFGWQDTYAFTKAMGEMMIDHSRGNVPVVVIRPSVIESTYKDPFPGWMEGNRMMDPIILHYGKGELTGFLVDPNGVLDVVPADMVVNATLAAMAKHGAAINKECNIYQVTSSVVNPLVFRDLAQLLYQHFSSSPFIGSTGSPVRVPKMKLFSSMQEYSSHHKRHTNNRVGLGALANLNGGLSQKLEHICRKSVEQAEYLANLYEFYTFYSGRFDNSNTKKLMGCMSNEERQQFGFDVEKIEWKDYITNVHIPGLRRHVMKGRGQSI